MSAIDVISAASVEPQPINWLAPGRLARGHLHILDGDPCTGKSFIALDIARALSLGEVPFATGALPEGAPAGSLLLMAEDSIADTLVPRLKAMGANLEHIHFYSQKHGQPWSVPDSSGDIPLESTCFWTGKIRRHVMPCISFLPTRRSTRWTCIRPPTSCRPTGCSIFA